MIGHLLEPAAAPTTRTAVAGYGRTSDSRGTSTQICDRRKACYRIERLLSQSKGRRIFLATDVLSQEKVVLKLLLLDEDPAQDVRPIAQSPEIAATLNYSLMLPYLASFEAETVLGSGLVMVQPYVEEKQYDSCSRHQRFPGHRVNVEPSRRESDRSAARNRRIRNERDLSVISKAIVGAIAPTPQTLNADFKVNPSFKKLEVQFLAKRLSGQCPVPLESSLTDRLFADDFEQIVFIVLGTVVFVGGTVVITGSVFLSIVVATVLPGLYSLLRAATKPQKKRARKAILRLQRTANEHVQLSLTTQSLGKRVGKGVASAWSCLPAKDSTLHVANLPVTAVKVSSRLTLRDGLCGQLRFSVMEKAGNQAYHIDIVGTHSQVKWLRNHLSEWAKLTPNNADDEK